MDFTFIALSAQFEFLYDTGRDDVVVTKDFLQQRVLDMVGAKVTFTANTNVNPRCKLEGFCNIVLRKR